MNTFNEWFETNLADYADDIANHGADAGFPHITYYSDTEKLYAEFEQEIYDALAYDAESMGYENVDAMTSQFVRSDMLDDPVSRRCLLVWYMCERTAQEYIEEETA